ncbi:VapE domain-containing protein [Variovorax sp. 3P27G3]|jgi:hypothetical protein|uniref:VapE domain-containing protein n=1 Tax=Variovorax sp. 3P27G3 TaxID=2502214 RepID=UPI0010F8339E|nr:VapE domain-containing protein [Variovorax sp. 3P27G3]
MSERYTTTRMPHARPLGGPSVMAGQYTGAELTTRSARPGAYDALALPSLVGGRQVSREQMREELLAPLPPAPPMPSSRNPACLATEVEVIPQADAQQLKKYLTSNADAYRPSYGERAIGKPAKQQLIFATGSTDFIPPETGNRRFFVVDAARPPAAERNNAPAPYRPREGSGPHQVLKHLQQHGGHLLYTEICARFDIPSHSLTAIFKPALTRGAIIRLHIGNRRALALPGYVPPGQVATTTDAQLIDTDQVRPVAAPEALAHAADNAEAFAVSAAALGRTLENTARLLMQFAAALPSLNH